MSQARYFSIQSALAITGLIFWSTACGSAGAAGAKGADRVETPPVKLTIFAAASLSEVMDEIVPEFTGQLTETVPAVSLDLNLAGSQELRTQLQHGAKGDVFLSADSRQMEMAVLAGLVQGKPINFTTNNLVVIVAKSQEPAGASEQPPGGQSQSNPPHITALKDLAGPGVSLALALPQVPAGAYARDAIQELEAVVGADVEDYASRVMANVVTLETNVRGVAMKVALGEVDAGIVYLTDARAQFVAENTRQIPIPPEANQQAKYLAAAIMDSPQPDLAEQFVEFLLSPQGQTILRSHEFGPLPPLTQENTGETWSLPDAAPAASFGLAGN
ncbi:MAG: molybdate ABC transporter substrate-binding protein [SAR202 cluster bacterium Io17-Chloro-G9]|nr:MAG: molybdate ABC transporter substrate-binding protein [SAR202 cluster bacterium Io17-Chloro-G9]